MAKKRDKSESNYKQHKETKKNSMESRLLKETRTFGQKLADDITRWGGSWQFISGLSLALIIWIILNTLMVVQRWDPYPFILLNLFLSCLAAYQAPIILMSQHRAAERDRAKAERDYYINRKAERGIKTVQKDLAHIKRQLNKLK